MIPGVTAMEKTINQFAKSDGWNRFSDNKILNKILLDKYVAVKIANTSSMRNNIVKVVLDYITLHIVTPSNQKYHFFDFLLEG